MLRFHFEVFRLLTNMIPTYGAHTTHIHIYLLPIMSCMHIFLRIFFSNYVEILINDIDFMVLSLQTADKWISMFTLNSLINVPRTFITFLEYLFQRVLKLLFEWVNFSDLKILNEIIEIFNTIEELIRKFTDLEETF